MAVAAACTNLDPRATRTRLRGALVAGAEPKEILETLELISVLAIHGYASVPGCSRNLTSDDRVRAYQLIAPGHAAVVDVSDPRPGPHEVLLKVRAAGVCGTDLKLLKNGVAGMPVTLGHEIVGEIVELGSAVRGRAAREMVAVYELIGCGRCPACLRGEDNMCRRGQPGVPGVTRDGGMAERVVVPARNAVPIGDLDPLQAAPMPDAGMTALRAVERARPWLTTDTAAAVVGVGGLGHLAVQYIASTTDARVIAIDVDQTRLDLAERLGAAHAVLAGEGCSPRVRALNGGWPVDVVLEFVASQDTLDLAAGLAGKGGAIIVTGGGGGRLCITAAMGAGGPEREVTMIHTSAGTRADLQLALDVARRGLIQTRVQTFTLEEAPCALAELGAGRVIGRAVIVPGL